MILLELVEHIQGLNIEFLWTRLEFSVRKFQVSFAKFGHFTS